MRSGISRRRAEAILPAAWHDSPSNLYAAMFHGIIDVGIYACGVL